MKTRILIAAALAVCLTTAQADEQQTTAALEAGYKTGADQFKAGLAAALARPEVMAQLVGPLNKASDMLFDAEVNTDKIFKNKKSKPPVRFSREASIRLDWVTDRPPFLHQDNSDLYNRYRSAVVFAITTVSEEGKDTSNGIQVSIPISADPGMHWRFPNMNDATTALSDRLVDFWKARTDTAEQLYKLAIEYKEAKSR
jgi:hypothetical protein